MEMEKVEGIAIEEKKELTANVHSVESFGNVDGPGIRYVVFFQGCMLRCNIAIIQILGRCKILMLKL